MGFNSAFKGLMNRLRSVYPGMYNSMRRATRWWFRC